MLRLAMMRGDTHAFPVTLYDSDGSPLDLDLLSDITFTAKIAYDDDTDSITKTLDDGIDIVDAAAGTCTVTLQPADTSGLTYSRRFVWDIQVVEDYDYATDATKTVARGHLFVYRDVT